MSEEKQLINFLKSQRELLKNYQNEKDKDDDNLNLFSSISDAYKRENYSSDILAFILNPNALGDKTYLAGFLKFIGLKTTEVNFFVSENNISYTKIKREENRIDLLIKNEKTKKAIIIESKINGAEDQPMQLVRYYKKIKEEKLDILKIVYLTVYSKRPDLKFVKGYDGITESQFNEIEKEIHNLLFNTFISNDEVGDVKRHFQSGYLNSKKFIDNEIILQFKKLMDKLGRGVFMNEKKIIKKIYYDGTRADIDNLQNLLEIYNNRRNGFLQIFKDNFKNDFKIGNAWEYNKDDQTYEMKTLDDNLTLYYCPIAYKKKFDFWTDVGFHIKEGYKGKKKILEEVIRTIVNNKNIDVSKNSVHELHCEPEWYCLQYSYDEDGEEENENKRTLKEYFEYIKGLIDDLQIEARKKKLIE